MVKGHLGHGTGTSPGCTRHLLHVILGYTPHSQAACLHKVFKCHVINALGGEDDVGACIQDLLDALLGDVELALADLEPRAGGSSAGSS